MNNSKTPKIVVGVGLVAVYATALAMFTLRGAHDSVVAQSLPAAVPTPVAADAAPAPEASSPAATPAPIAPEVSTAARAPDRMRPLVASESKPRAQQVPVAHLVASTPPARSDAEESSPGNSGSDAANESAATADAGTGESVTAATDAPSGQ